MAVTAALRLYATGELTNALDLGTSKFPFGLSTEVSLTTGTAAGMADKVFAARRTLSASATEDLDLAGVLTDGLGASLTFVTIKAVIITAASGNTNNVNLTRPASNGVPLFLAAGDGIAIKPGYSFAWFGSGTGVTVTAATGDLLTLTNSAGSTSVTYSILVLGTSA
jgi:hypothetical protein